MWPYSFHALPLDHTKPVKKVSQLTTYHIGRLLTYSIIGALFGLLGRGLFLRQYQQQLSIIIGILLILAVIISFLPIKPIGISRPVYLFISKVKSGLGKQLHGKGYRSLFSIGLLNGLLPCGLVYMALFGAIAMASPLESSLYMFFFGIGTIPMMSAAVYLGNFISVKARRNIQKAIPFLVIVIGILFILRGMGLGIPYISPSNMNLMVKEMPDCVVP